MKNSIITFNANFGNWSALESIVFRAMTKMDVCVLGDTSFGKGGTFMMVCAELGFSGTNDEVYTTIETLLSKGVIKKGFCYTDSIFYLF